MRRKKSIIVFLFTAVAFSVSAQNKGRRKIKVDRQREEVVTIKDTTTSFQEERPTYHITQEDRERMKYTKTIPIGTNVFVQLVFSSAVQVVRSGAPDMAMVKNEDNVVTIQALREDVKSNISVKTADGLYYSYKIVSEDDKDIPLFYEIPIADAVNGKSKLIEDNKRKIVEKMSAQEVAQTIYSYDGYIKNRNVGSYKDIYISIRGIYIDKGKLYFLLHFANKSDINYRIERLQFFTMPIKKSKKRIENEEKEYNPIFYYKNLTDIKSNSEEVMVAVFDQFTLNDQKKIQVTMTENGGERTVKLDIDNNIITAAKKL